MKTVSTQNETKNLSITIYNNGYGVVKEERALNLGKDIDQVQFVDVAEKIETNSLIVKGLHILEMNYDYDLVSKEKLLEKYLDRHVWIVSSNDQTEYRLLSVASGMVLENVVTKEIVIDPEGQLILPSLPDELIVKPALIWKIRPSESTSVQVSYITKGIEWTANYVVNFEPTHLKLSGWVDIQNQSGATYQNANLKLIAGEVKRVDQETDYHRDDEYILYNSSPEISFEEKSFADYHMYTLQNQTTLKQNQSKQINFIELGEIPYKKYYEMGRWDDNPRILIEFKNDKASGMGLPLPKGLIKVYQEDDQDHHLEFVGEDSITHTPKDEEIQLCLGEAFDIKCFGYKADSRREGRYEYIDFRYDVRNHKDESALMKISHYISDHWEMVETSDPYDKESANEITFWVDIEANTTKTIHMSYRIDRGMTVEVTKKD